MREFVLFPGMTVCTAVLIQSLPDIARYLKLREM